MERVIEQDGAARRYAVVIERAYDEHGRFANYSAYVPDLPGCISVGDTLDELEANIREAIELHLEGLRAEGLPIPDPETTVTIVRVPA